MKKILGLDLGTNSIGAALINIPKTIDDFGKEGNIEWIGSRIIPVDGDYLQKFESGGQAETKAAARRMKRGSRRLKHRYKLRRSRLVQVFKILGWVEESFPLDDSKKIKEIIGEEGKFTFCINDYLPFSNETIEEATELLGVKAQRNKYGNIVVPEDWIIYYLRKKALSKKITLAELARIIYMMNQRRGFKSSRKDLKETTVLNIDEFIRIKQDIDAGNLQEYQNGEGESLETKFVSITKIKLVEQDGEEKDKKGNYTFTITAEDSRLESWQEKRKKKPEWVGKEVTLVVTQKVDKNGKFTQNKPQLPKDEDWELNMVALDNQIGNKTPGSFFWDKLVEDKNYKIRQTPVRREKYQCEFEAIWKKQCELNPALAQLNQNKDILKNCAQALYPAQSEFKGAKLKELLSHDLLHIISKDIIYYQRELKSQKNSVGECQYEKMNGKEKNANGEFIETGTYGLKCAPKSSPEFQEFRIWQDIHNIRIFEKEQRDNDFVKIDVDVTKNLIDDTAKEKLFELFDTSREVSEQNIFSEFNKLLPSDKKLNKDRYRINLFANRDKLAGNETKDTFRKIFKKHNYEDEGEKLMSDKNILRKLWHINYSISSSDVNKSEKGILTALGWNKDRTKKWEKEGDKNYNWQIFKLPKDIANAFTKLSEPKKQYAAYSSKAINKLLPLMRCGKYWSWENIHNETRERIDKIIKDGWDFAYDKRTGELIKEREFANQAQFSGLPAWMACYVAYGRHSERESAKKYTPEEIKSLDIMQLIPNNSLRNPIVEQVVRETLFLVKEICNQYGQPDEIHIEMGRELKKNAVEKDRIAKINRKNLEEKQRIKKLLYELLNGAFEHYDEDGEKINQAFEVKPNPENPTDVEKFRIYKSCAAITSDEEKENWEALFKSSNKERIPTNAELKKYALWLSQKCTSPYTGKIISLSKLFTEEYEVEHIIPRKKLKYDAFENFVICESGVNKAKGNELAAIFISHSNGKCKYSNKEYELLTYDKYTEHCKNTFKGRKLKNLLATEVPEDFVERQINDTRYITRKVSELLYPVAKDKAGLVFTIGSITSDLKREWGLNNVWKEIVKPRFERMEKITEQTLIVPDKEDANKFHLNVPDQPDFNDKRIDHRHHALDALIVAATTREHIRYLNSLNAVDSSEELQKVKRALVKGKIRDYKLPWESFTKEAKDKLCETIVTFKSNNKVVSKPANKYVKWFKSNGSWEKKEVFQKPNRRWMAVRKSMFKEPQGIIWLKEKKEVSVLDAFKIQIERMKVEQDKEKRKTASYVYDQLARQNIKQIIENIDIELDSTELLKEVQKYLKKNIRKIETGAVKKNGKPEFKTVYFLGGQEYENVWIAEFVEYAAKRVSLDKSFTHEKINKIPYANDGKSIIGKLLHKHLSEYELYIEKAKELKKKEEELTKEEKEFLNNPVPEPFIGEGLEALAKKNNGKRIEKVTIYEKKSPEDKFGSKYVEVDKGAIVYFIIYENEQTKERPEMYSLATHKAIEGLVQGKPIAGKREGYNTIILSPDDLVYVPTPEQLQAIKENKPEPINWSDKEKIGERIYRIVSSSKKECFFIQHQISTAIIPYNRKEKIKGEIDWNDKSTKTMDGHTTISSCCIKIDVDRLGNIKIANSKNQNYHQSPDDNNVVKESSTIYSPSKKITISDSFEDAANSQMNYWSGLTPEQRFYDFYNLMNRFYSFNKPDWSTKKIIFNL